MQRLQAPEANLKECTATTALNTQLPACWLLLEIVAVGCCIRLELLRYLTTLVKGEQDCSLNVVRHAVVSSGNAAMMAFLCWDHMSMPCKNIN